ncbi:Hsp20/alpha crystallin family protein [Desulfoplanes sp.]
MAKFTRNPWLEIQAMKDEIGRMMDDDHNQGRSTYLSRERQAHFKPVADVYENTDGYVIQVELSGMERDAVNMEIFGRELIVFGERRHEKDIGGNAYHVLERSYGPFARRFDLPGNADVAGIKATMQKGILTVAIPKKDRKKTGRRIEIQEG